MDDLPVRVNWNDWSAMREKYHLRMVGFEWKSGGGPVMYVERERSARKKAPVISAKETRLGRMLGVLFMNAIGQPGNPVRVTLPAGMRVDVKLGMDGALRMQISREKVYPSEVEWRTTVKNLPFEKVEVGEVEKFEDKGAFYMRAELRFGA